MSAVPPPPSAPARPSCPSCGAPSSHVDDDGLCDWCGHRTPVAPPPAPVWGAGDVHAAVLAAQAAHAAPRRKGRGGIIALAVVGTLVAGIGGCSYVVATATSDSIKSVSESISEATKEATEGAVGLEGTPGAPGAPGAGAGPGPVVGPRARLVLRGAATTDLTIPTGAACASLAQGGTVQVTFDEADGSRWAVLAAPEGAAGGAGSWQLGGRSRAFVSVNRIVGGQTLTWGSLLKPGASGTLTRAADGAVSASFEGLVPVSGGAAGALGGELTVTCQ